MTKHNEHSAHASEPALDDGRSCAPRADVPNAPETGCFVAGGSTTNDVLIEVQISNAVVLE